VSETEEKPLIRPGRRVECRKQGPFKGKRGKVDDVWMGQALVHFDTSTVTFPVEYFEVVGGS